MKLLCISEKTTNKHIAALKKLAIISRENGRKDGIWIVNYENIRRGEEKGEEKG
jgi:predicted HTH transcriptional regulator